MNIGIVGIGLSEFRIHDEPFYNVAFDAAKKALDDASLERREIDGFVLGGYDNLGVGRTISNMYTAPAAGAYLQHEIRVSEDASFALPLAYMRARGGLSDVVMVLGFGQSSETPLELVELQSLDPLFHRDLKIAPQMGYALQSYAYRNEFNVKEERLAEVVVEDRKKAKNNEYAFKRDPVTVEEVLSSEMAVYPLRKLEIAEWCDGCVALIIAEETIAKRITDSPIWIKGVGWSVDNYFLGSRDLKILGSVKNSAKMAYKMADVSQREVEGLEIMDLTTDYHFMILESLGFAELGKGSELLGSINVNNSGGALCTSAYGSTGLYLVANLALQIRAGEIDLGLAQAMTGYAAQNACVSILGV
ncbi:hypothetical protein DRP04_01365 [Archaeoglobales archaeon]|nr:MAG: hypothetical protein DRP04_01365 [Archaeoglobales archaeon]HDN74433.1 thiolase family protein [Archaeoglobus sp.]